MALGTCMECGKECSSNAHACPHCGNPFRKPAPPAAKTSGCAWIALIFIAVPFLLFFIGSMNRSASGPSASPISEAECKKSLQCWGDRHSGRATVACTRAVEAQAEYQAEWTDGALESKFPTFGWADQSRGTLRYRGDKVKFQNGFGAWKNMRYACLYNPDSANPPEVLIY